MAEITPGDVHVDRAEELARFGEMTSATGTAHVLLIQAEAGMGKSSLLREFWDRSAGLSRILVDFKPRTHSVEGVLGELSSQNRPAFKHFFEQLERLSSAASIVISRSEISKSSIDLTNHSNMDTPEHREIRWQLLTDAFFSDLVASNPSGKPTVVIFDTYEEASDEVKDWLARLFLTGVRGYRWLVAVVAGQKIPQLGIGWDDWCLKQTLRPLGPEHVGEYLRQIELRLSEHDVTMLYETTDGIPLDLSISAARLLRKRGVAHG